MAEITAALVKDLREKSGVGMMDCKRALQENDGNLEAAMDWLRAKGLSKAAKKSDRAAAEGLVAGKLSDDGKTGVLVELNAETDFVSKNDTFQSAARDFATVALGVDGDVDAIAAAKTAKGEVVGDPDVVIAGLPARMRDGRATDDMVDKIVFSALDGLSRGRRRERCPTHAA